MASAEKLIRYDGLAVAVIGFVITRLFVAEAIQVNSLVEFMVAGLPPMLIGLSLSIFGVSLAVGPFSDEYVSTIAKWCFLSFFGVLLIVTMTSIDSLIAGRGFERLRTSPLLIGNILLGGAIGGVIFGNRVATTHRQQQQIQNHANGTLLLDRLLRHEVINAASIIAGYARILQESPTADQRKAGASTIEQATQRITSTINQVGDLIETPEAHSHIDLEPLLRDQITTIQNRFPEVDTELSASADTMVIAADSRIAVVFEEVLENAAEDTETSKIQVEVDQSPYSLALSISDDGSGLSQQQRSLLESGDFPEYDDASAGFGLQITRLLVQRYNGEITIGSGIENQGTTITCTFPRFQEKEDLSRPITVSRPDLYRVAGSGLVAGVIMGVYFGLSSDLIPVIGALYSIADPIVGWVTHLFHSIVFAIIFAGAISHPDIQDRVDHFLHYGILGIGWGIVLWLFAAGVIMPLWLQAVGKPAILPNLTGIGLVSHLIWGLALGMTYQLLRKWT